MISGIISLVLWFIFAFFNPYAAPANTPTFITFVMLFLPACLAIYASAMVKLRLLLTAFVWSLPISLYVYFTPGIFSWFGITSLAYLFSFILIFVSQKLSEMKKLRQDHLSNTG